MSKFRVGDLITHRSDPRRLVVNGLLSNNRLLVNFARLWGRKGQPDWEVYAVECRLVE